MTETKNHAKQIAEMLGLEIGEKFRIKGHPGFGTFWFVEDNSQGLRDIWDYDTGEDLYDEFNDVNDLLEQLLTGFYEVEKLPWKPKKGDLYCYLHTDYGTGRARAILDRWDGDFHDMLMWSSGNCFKTKEEAQAKSDEMYEKLRKEFEEA